MVDEGEAPRMEDSEDVGSRPASGDGGSRPSSGAGASRPSSGAGASRPSSGAGASRPASGARDNGPASGAEPSRPASGAGASRPVSGAKASRPASSATDSRPASSATDSRPASGAAASRPATGAVSSRTASSALSSRPGSRTQSMITKSDEPDILTLESNEKTEKKKKPCIYNIWYTKELMDEDEEEKVVVKTTIRELVVYSVFLLVLSIVTFSMTSPIHYHFKTMLGNQFTDQLEVHNADSFWEFMEGQFLDGLFWEEYYNDGDFRSYVCQTEDEQIGPCELSDQNKNILYENKVLGLARLRQLRVKDKTCTIPEDFSGVILNCWAPYEESFEDTSSFLPKKARKFTEERAWSYQTADQMDVSNVAISGKVGTYSGHGSIQNLGTNRNETSRILMELKNLRWIGRSTRAVMIDFTIYNVNINAFCVTNFLFEFPATGGVLASSDFNTVKLLRYVNTYDYFIFVCEIIYFIFVLYYIVEEILEIKKCGVDYFKGFWNDMDIIVVVLSIISQSLNMYVHLTVETQIGEILQEPESYPDFRMIGNLYFVFTTCLTLCSFFGWIKLFKYVSFNKTMTQLTTTLSRSSGDLVAFSVMFFIIFFAFAQLGFLLFGTQVNNYGGFTVTLFTLLRLILGDFDFDSLDRANRLIGPLYFMSYVFFVFFVLLNMFLAIINDTYGEVKADLASQQNEFELGDYVKKGFTKLLRKIGIKNKLQDIVNSAKDPNSEGEITRNDIREQLKKCNFSDLEIEMFFQKYDLNEDNEEGFVSNTSQDQYEGRPKSGKEARAMRAQSVRIRSARFNNNNSSVTSVEQFAVLTQKVDEMEGVIGNIVAKIDMVLIKLEGIELSKEKRKETMFKIFEGITKEETDDEMEIIETPEENAENNIE